MFLSLHFLIFIFSWQLHSAETDGFTSRYDIVEDALPLINREVNLRASSILKKLNIKKKEECDWNELHTLLGEEWRRPFQGQIENYITCNNHIPKSDLDFPNSIYKNLSFINYAPIKIGTFLGIGFTPPIHHKGLLIGADKFGHFLDEGHYYYLLIYKWNYTLEEVLELGIFAENYLEGKLTGGVYSYADLAANYDGHLFWKDILGEPSSPQSSLYFSCQKGTFQLKKEIDLSLYISSAWDEGMNCNEYRSDSMKSEIEQSIKELESRSQKRYSCPVYLDRVPEMIQHYGLFSHKIINPKLMTK